MCRLSFLTSFLVTAGILLPGVATAQTFSRTEVIAYHDSTTNWVLGQTASVTCTASIPASTACDGDVVSSTTFDPTFALPISASAFGKLQQTWSYDVTSSVESGQRGTLKTVSDGRDSGTFDTTVSYAGWSRGLPSLISFPDGTSLAAQVNANGWIDWVRNEAGFTTSYAYDAMGRLARVDYPIGDTVSWNDTHQTFTQVATAEYGIPAGHWRQTVSTGNGFKVIYYDAMWRPLLTREYDAGDVTGTQRFVRHAYDANGRTVFTSYPSASSSPANGVWITYDALGRQTSIRQNSELGNLFTTIEYLPGFLTRVTNPRGFATTTSFMAFDQPTTDWPEIILHPENVVTEILRDPLGKPLAITREDGAGTTSLTRHYAYNGYQELCRTIEPETGATLMGYDAAGNLAWSASGLPASTACSTTGSEAAIATRKTTRQYDARNRLTALTFADDTPDNTHPKGNGSQTWDYTPDGLPEAITTINYEGAQETSALNVYTYNRRRLPAGESLTLSDQAGNLSIGYGYDTNGHLASHTYPGGLVVAYAPNALGQPKQAGSYATSVRYFPNGALRQFTYGNGIVHTLEQNVRGLPDRSCDLIVGGLPGDTCSPAGSTKVHDDSLTYDANGNVMAISDGATGTSQRGNRTMSYDGLDRLLSTASPMFSGTAVYAYDAIDNLTRVKVPGRDHYYCYDGSNRVTNISSAACSSQGSTLLALGYDLQGNLSNRNGINHRFNFDFGNRLREAVGKEIYRYDAHGRRILASNSTGSIHSFYGQDGVLRYQEDKRKGEIASYIYLGGSLVAKNTDLIAAPAAPVLSVGTVNQTAGSYTLSWNATGASSRLDESTDGGVVWTEVANTAGTSWSASSKPSGTYQYRVRGCAVQCSVFSNLVSVTINRIPVDPPTITQPTGGTNGTGSFTVGWTGVVHATKYQLQQRHEGGTWSVIHNTTSASKAVTVSATGTYEYRARGCNSLTQCGPWSALKTIVVNLPVVPILSVPAQGLNGDYTVSWTSATGASRYELQESANGGTWIEVQDGPALSKTWVDRPAGTYAYRVNACNQAGCTVFSASDSVQVIYPPNAPVINAPTYGLNGDYTVSWTSSAGATRYELQESASGGAWIEVQDSTALSKTWADRPAGSYAYRVAACNQAGCGAFSATQTVTVVHKPASPPALTVPASGHNGSYTISWGSVATASSYTLQQSANGGSWTTAYTGAGLSKIYSGVAAGSYAYRVQACNVAGCSAFSATQAVTVVHKPASAPTLTVPGSGHNGSYTISWGSVATATSYTLQQSANGGSWATAYSGASLSKAYSGVAAGSYAYRVRACNVAGCSAFTAAQTVTVVHKPASAPSLTAPAEGHNGSYTISWGSVANATSYTLQQSANGGTWATAYSGAGLSKAYSGVAAGSYAYRVQACNVAGCGAFSTIRTTVVTYPPAGAPSVSAPYSVNSGDSFTVSWTSVGTATRYELEERKDAGSWTSIYNGAGTSTTLFRLNGEYAYRARACNASGCGPYSAERSLIVENLGGCNPRTQICDDPQ